MGVRCNAVQLPHLPCHSEPATSILGVNPELFIQASNSANDLIVSRLTAYEHKDNLCSYKSLAIYAQNRGAKNLSVTVTLRPFAGSG